MNNNKHSNNNNNNNKNKKKKKKKKKKHNNKTIPNPSFSTPLHSRCSSYRQNLQAIESFKHPRSGSGSTAQHTGP
ncbi:hypothetical protein H4I95_01840 [Botrytis cinerea]